MNGLPFYVKKNNRGVQYFNLPLGVYKVYGNLTKLKKPIRYKLPLIAKKYINKKLPRNFKIMFGENPNKCTVDLSRNTIFFDNRFRHETDPTIAFICRHELGHYRYAGKGAKSEFQCDTFATYCMLLEGFNPSQIRAAILYSLGNSNLGLCRKNYNKDILKIADNVR